MLASSQARILDRLEDGDLVLDVGGAASPFARADWVIDVLPYERRGLYGAAPDAASERFGPETWVVRDICAREPWPFAENQFDFSICSHTLEDVRDPVFVCSELIRVSKAGYIEVPSRLEEQSQGIQGPWVGWGHHHWLVDIDEGAISFVFKHHVLHARASDHFPTRFWRSLTAEERVSSLWWEGSFHYGERLFLDAPSLDSYLADFVARHGPGPRRRWRRGR
jgi:hypothetical protein